MEFVQEVLAGPPFGGLHHDLFPLSITAPVCPDRCFPVIVLVSWRHDPISHCADINQESFGFLPAVMEFVIMDYLRRLGAVGVHEHGQIFPPEETIISDALIDEVKEKVVR